MMSRTTPSSRSKCRLWYSISLASRHSRIRAIASARSGGLVFRSLARLQITEIASATKKSSSTVAWPASRRRFTSAVARTCSESFSSRAPTRTFASRTTSAIVERVDVVHRVASEPHHREGCTDSFWRNGFELGLRICARPRDRDDSLALFGGKLRQLLCERLERVGKSFRRGTPWSHDREDSAFS